MSSCVIKYDDVWEVLDYLVLLDDSKADYLVKKIVWQMNLTDAKKSLDEMYNKDKK